MARPEGLHINFVSMAGNDTEKIISSSQEDLKVPLTDEFRHDAMAVYGPSRNLSLGPSRNDKFREGPALSLVREYTLDPLPL